MVWSVNNDIIIIQKQYYLYDCMYFYVFWQDLYNYIDVVLIFVTASIEIAA